MKLHQLMVNEKSKQGAYEKIVAETLKTFKSLEPFTGLEKSYNPKAADGDPLPHEKKQVVTTVPARLDYTQKTVIELIDFESTKNKANQGAIADLVVDGKTIAKNLPAPTLLFLEKRLTQVRDYYDKIPTLDATKEWTLVDGTDDLYQHGPIKTYRYVKQSRGVILSPATDKFPAQVKEVTDDVLVGEFTQKNFAGLISSARKANLLGRIDTLIEACREARMKANEAPVEKVAIGQALFDFINTDEE